MKKALVILLTLVALAVPQLASATITAGTATNQTTGTSVSYNAGAGSNRYLLIGVNRRDGSTISMTYNGVAMTQLGTSGGHVNANDTFYLFGLVAPTTGAHNVVITHNGTGVWWIAEVYNGVDQTTPTEACTTAGSGSGVAAVTVTPTKTDWLVGGAWQGVGSNGATANANTTLRNAGSQDNDIVFDTNVSKTSATSIGITNTTSYDMVGCGLIDATQPPPVSTFNLWQFITAGF